jgi:uncharacterized protein
MQNKVNNSYALITGGTSGIGYELSKLFAKDGYHLILVARTTLDLERVKEELTSLYNVQVTTISKDLFKPDAAKEVYEEVKSMGIRVDVLVNDAGQGVYGLFVEEDIHRQLDIIRLNIDSLVVLTYYFLKEMVARNEGKILNLASVVSDVPAPLQAVYGGTKAFVKSFTSALISEYKPTNITITALQPGATDTDFFNKAGGEESKINDPKLLDDPAEVALTGYKALMEGDASVVHGMKNKIQNVMSNILPDTVNADMLKKQTEPKKK